MAWKIGKNPGYKSNSKNNFYEWFEITGHDISNAFAVFFEKKVNDIVDENVYNDSINTFKVKCKKFLLNWDVYKLNCDSKT